MSSVKVADNSEQYKEAMQEAVEAALEAIGIQAEGYAKLELENNPRRIDTGLLRNSITHAVSGERTAIDEYRSSEKDSNGNYKRGNYRYRAPDAPDDKKAVYMGTNVEYAPYVHEGTKKMQPNRFIKNAVQKHIDEYKAIAEKYIKKALKAVQDKPEI